MTVVPHTDTLSFAVLVVITLGGQPVAVRQRNARYAHVSYAGTKHPLAPSVMMHAREKTTPDGVHLTIGTLMLPQFTFQLMFPCSGTVITFDETPDLQRCIFAPSGG